VDGMKSERLVGMRRNSWSTWIGMGGRHGPVYARNCDPPVHVVVEPVGAVTVVHVRESDAKPVQCSEGFFWRQGAVTQKLSRDEIRDFFRSEGTIRFDLSLCPRFRYPEDFDRERYKAWLQLSGISGRPRTEDVLINIEVAERSGGKLLFRNAGVLFFAKNVRHFFNQAYVTCLLAKGTDKVHVLDRKDFDGGIVADLEDAMRFVERNTRTAWRIEALQRENIPEYPMKALREAITNAVMHRDWFIDGANVFVELYTDRIEVSSPGGLYKGMTLADLGHKSVRRNALIADLLHRIEFIEKAGTGIKRIRDEAHEQGCPEPRFESNMFFTATFRPNPAVRALVEAQSDAQPADRQPPSAPQVEAHDEAHDEAHEPMTNVEQALLSACVPAPRSTPELLQALGYASRTGNFKKALLRLLARHLLEMTSPQTPRAKHQRYRITPRGREALKSIEETK
jgi:ATP-dependent DNA helicase RecG